MKEGPDIATLGALVGDPARANILTALMSGQALTASELALECGVTAQTVSSHLAKLEAGGLIAQRKQGRYRYFNLSGEDVGRLLENMMGLAASRGHTRLRPGPRDPALRKARVCYNHLAGEMGVAMLDSLVRSGDVIRVGGALNLSQSGHARMREFGIDPMTLQTQRRPLCLSCLDWSARRDHLAGALGSALLLKFQELGWAIREEGTRVIRFSPKGMRAFGALFPT